MSTPASNLHAEDDPVGRARLNDPANFFAFQLPRVPRRQFVAERDRAFDPAAETGEVLLDAADELGTAYPATTPLLLARYIVIRAGEQHAVHRAASAEVHYVLRGAGSSDGYGEHIDWQSGDVFSFPGGGAVAHSAEQDSVLFSVCNEPLLAFEALLPPMPGHARVRPVHWRHGAIEALLEEMYAKPKPADASGRAVQLSSVDMHPALHTVPSMNVAINTLEAGGDQRPHRHNGAAITLAIRGDGVYSQIEGERVDWADGAAQITPAAELHSHHNRGAERMESLVVQDEGLHFYTRTPGFSWT